MVSASSQCLISVENGAHGRFRRKQYVRVMFPCYSHFLDGRVTCVAVSFVTQTSCLSPATASEVVCRGARFTFGVSVGRALLLPPDTQILSCSRLCCFGTASPASVRVSTKKTSSWNRTAGRYHLDENGRVAAGSGSVQEPQPPPGAAAARWSWRCSRCRPPRLCRRGALFPREHAALTRWVSVASCPWPGAAPTRQQPACNTLVCAACLPQHG